MPTNPILWPGPTFLAAYVMLAVVVVLAFRVWLKARAARRADPVREEALLADPYTLAYLRGGGQEVVRVAAFTLLDRGLLTVDAQRKVVAKPFADTTGLREIERQVLARFDKPTSMFLFLEQGVWAEQVCRDYREGLVQTGLLNGPDPGARALYWVLVVAMVGLAVAKVAHALAEGRHNVLFLSGAAILFWIFLRPLRRRLTPRGAQALQEQQVLMAGLRRGSPKRMRRNKDDAVWIASVFGLAGLTVAAFPALAYMGHTGAPAGAGAGGGAGGSTTTTNCGSAGHAGSGGASDGGGSGCGGCGGGGGD